MSMSEILKWFPTPIAGLVAGFAAGYLAFQTVNSDRIAAINEQLKDRNGVISDLKSDKERLQGEVAQLRSSLTREQEASKSLVPASENEKVRQALSDAIKQNSELSAKIQKYASEPLPAVQESVSMSVVWAPWGEAGPNFSFRYDDQHFPLTRVAISSDKAFGKYIVLESRPDQRGHSFENFVYNRHRYTIFLNSVSGSVVNVAVMPTSRLIASDKE